MNNPHPPWHLICKQAVRGTALETLSRQFAVPVDQIKERLDLAIEHSAVAGLVKIRSNAEISYASQSARSDLVTVLLEAIAELKASATPRLDQLDKLTALLSNAQKLFSWPTVSMSRSVSYGYSSQHQPESLVNLALTATTPEQLATLSGRTPDVTAMNAHARTEIQ